MTQPTLDEKQLAQLADSLELAITVEQQAKKLCELAETFAQKYEKRLYQIRQVAKQNAGEIE